MAEGINSIEELRKAQAAAQSQGTSITNYEEWANILEDLSIAGVQSTGNYASDVRLHSRLMAQIEAVAETMQVESQQHKIQPQHNEIDKTDYKAARDSEQTIKANVANSVSSTAMADYMKYYHLLS